MDILYKATNQSQKADLTLSDFYGCWLLTKIKLEKVRQIHTNLATKLTLSLSNREKFLFDNKAMCAAVYLDPRFKMDLTVEHIQTARKYLAELWTALTNSQNRAIDENNENDLLENYFMEKGFGTALSIDSNIPNFSITRNNFLVSLDKFDNTTSRLHHSFFFRAEK